MSKYGAKKVRATVGGQDCRFDSQAEWKYALWLEGERKARRIVSWEHHPEPVELTAGVHEAHVCTIAPDFLVVTRDDRAYHEVKGFATAAWRFKRRLFEATRPEGYVVIDAQQVDPPRLFDDRPRRKKRRRK